jgi:hypothetical protein
MQKAGSLAAFIDAEHAFVETYAEVGELIQRIFDLSLTMESRH